MTQAAINNAKIQTAVNEIMEKIAFERNSIGGVRQVNVGGRFNTEGASLLDAVKQNDPIIGNIVEVHYPCNYKAYPYSVHFIRETEKGYQLCNYFGEAALMQDYRDESTSKLAGVYDISVPKQRNGAFEQSSYEEHRSQRGKFSGLEFKDLATLIKAVDALYSRSVENYSLKFPQSNRSI